MAAMDDPEGFLYPWHANPRGKGANFAPAAQLLKTTGYHEREK